jgi:hypothetical protein
MNRQLKDHHVGTPCPVCVGLIEEIAALRLALLNAETERDAAQQEAAEHTTGWLSGELVEL